MGQFLSWCTRRPSFGCIPMMYHTVLVVGNNQLLGFPTLMTPIATGYHHTLCEYINIYGVHVCVCECAHFIFLLNHPLILKFKPIENSVFDHLIDISTLSRRFGLKIPLNKVKLTQYVKY